MVPSQGKLQHTETGERSMPYLSNLRARTLAAPTPDRLHTIPIAPWPESSGSVQHILSIMLPHDG